MVFVPEPTATHVVPLLLIEFPLVENIVVPRPVNDVVISLIE